MSPLSYMGVGLIRIYQRTFSPDHGFLQPFFPNGACKFQPTCSAYTVEAMKKYGFFQGGIRGGRRILRCHPWSNGGVDNP